jgi:hypothetical protein
MPTIDLKRKPSYLRSGISRGLDDSTEHQVDRRGGQSKAGIIRGVAVATMGEARGHRMWLDSEFLDALTESVNQSPKGVKARFTHPGLSSDGLGKYLGKFRRAYRVDNLVRADLEFAASAHDTPDGDLAGYVMDMAEESPEDFGTSIVFEPDYGEEDRFTTENSDEKGRFVSPDPENKENYRHARLHRLRATDVVDEPAANPDGLFHATGIPEHADEYLSYALGLSDDVPAIEFDIEPDRLRSFVQRFLDRHNLAIKDKTMTAAYANPDDEVKQEEDTTAGIESDKDVVEQDDGEDVEEQDEEMSSRDECKRFLEAFGTQGAEWYAEGLSFEEANTEYAKSLAEENKRLKQLLKDARGEQEPLSSGVEPEVMTDAQKKERQLASQIGDNRAKYAASVKLKASAN